MYKSKTAIVRKRSVVKCLNKRAPKSTCIARPEDVIRVISKDDLLDLRKYEAKEGYEFNQKPPAEFLDELPDGRLLPVGNAFVHNGVEVRCITGRSGALDSVLVDMPFDVFFGLRQIDKNTGVRVNALPAPKSLRPFDPQKGVDYRRLLRKDELLAFNKSGVLKACDEFSVDKFIDDVPDDSYLEVNSAHFVSSGHLDCTSQIRKGPELRVVSFPLTVEMYFSLPIKVCDWPDRRDIGKMAILNN